MPTKPTINLIRSQEPKFLDKFLKWALTGGRFLVILTETVALTMFLYRFNIDRQLIDLHDLIQQKQVIVSHLTENEKSFRNLQERLQISRTVMTQPSQEIQVFADLIRFADISVNITNVVITDKAMTIQASTNSSAAMHGFIKNVRTFPSIETISLDAIDNKTSTSSLAFSLTAKLKPESQTQLPEVEGGVAQ